MALFQHTVSKKYLASLNKELLEQKWSLYASLFLDVDRQERIKSLKEEQYQRGFLDDLFVKVLGYTLEPDENFNLSTEYKNVKDSKKADGAILFDNKVRAVIELKGTNTTDLGKIENQAFGYKNNQPDCVYIITSNFEKLRFYIDNAIEHIDFNLFQLEQNEFELLYLCLAYENLSKGLAKKIKDESISEEDVITKKLYKDYSLFKRELFSDLVAKNPQLDQLQLFKKSQKLLDRFLFIFFAEDRQLLPPNSVRKILQQWEQLKDLDAEVPLYERFKKYFGYLNTGFKGKEFDVYAYNGGLFKPDDILDTIAIDDGLLYKHTLRLSEYDFDSEVDVNILGHIFENSLNELDEIKAQLEGQEIDKTKTKRKKDGVFYTPKYITKYIVENTIGKLCEEKKLELAINEEDYITDKKRQKKTLKTLLTKLEDYRNWLLQLTICDPACGSGAFLNQALDFLIEEHKYIDELQAKLFGDALVLTDMENSILENNLFGVDLNEESVEIAKLSLWLRTAQPNRKLNDLSGNIKCGNSLIDDPEIAGEKAFNWQQAFPQVFAKGGFDVVIGNPPYVVVSNKIENDFFTDKFYVSKGGKTNLYKLFFEKSHFILSNKGVLGFITPSNYLTSKDSFYLRDFLFNNTTFIDVVDYPEKFNVFENVTQAVAILIFQNGLPNDSYNFRYENIDSAEIIELNSSLFSKKNDFQIIFKNNLVIKLEKFNYKLGDFIEGYQGEINVSLNKEFFVKEKNESSYLPLIRGNHVGRYFLKQEIEEFCPINISKRTHHLKQRIIFQEVSNIGLQRRVNCIISDEYLCGHTTNYLFSKTDTLSNLFLLAIMNSKIINYYFKYFNKTNHVPIGEIKKIPVPDLLNLSKILIIEKADQMLSLNKELHKISQKFQRTLQRKFELEKLSKKLESWYELSFAEFVKELKKKKIKLSLSEEAEWEDYFLQEQQKALVLKQQIDKTDQQIDKMVYELYGLTDEEIQIVENS